MPNYTYLTFPQAIAALQARLYNSQFWTIPELQAYLIEALRTWQAFTGFWRDSFTFSLTQNVWWYDLTAQPGSLIPYTVGQYDLISQVEYHLLEPPTPAGWSGSLQYSLNDLLFSLQRAQDTALGVSGCTIAQSFISAPLSGRIVLPDNVIDIRRVAWLPNSGLGYSNKVMRQSDQWAIRAFKATTYPNPTEWVQSTDPPPSFEVDTNPPVAGQYDVLTVNSSPAWVAGVNGSLNVPDDWTWVIKWGALKDLLDREGNAKDTLRARYCEQRFTQGMALLEQNPTVLSLALNGQLISVDPVRAGDDFNPNWQAQVPASPMRCYATGNLLAFAPAPNSSSAYSVTVTVEQNAPVDTTQPIQAGRDELDAILAYAQHLAMFKQGGAEFAQTLPLYQKFIREASLYNSKLKEMGFFELPMLDISQLEEQRRARYVPGEGPAMASKT